MPKNYNLESAEKLHERTIPLLRETIVFYCLFVGVAWLALVDPHGGNVIDRGIADWSHSIGLWKSPAVRTITKLGDKQVVVGVCWISLGVLAFTKHWRLAPVLLIATYGATDA